MHTSVGFEIYIYMMIIFMFVSALNIFKSQVTLNDSKAIQPSIFINCKIYKGVNTVISK